MNANNSNLKYCLQFLKNGGERWRAIRLCADATGMGLLAAKDFVENLHEPYPCINPDKPLKFCPECLNHFTPATPSCPVCGNTKLVEKKYE